MRVLMLGWEYPPVVSGGLGTATEGLVRGLLNLGHKVTLLLPYFPLDVDTEGLEIVSPQTLFRFLKKRGLQTTNGNAKSRLVSASGKGALRIRKRVSHYKTKGIDLRLSEERKRELRAQIEEMGDAKTQRGPVRSFEGIVEQVYLLSELTKKVLSVEHNFDIIHAHDWMTFSALHVARAHSNIPTVAHFHSTEFDRSGQYGNSQIVELESQGLVDADAVITVSEYSRSMLAASYKAQIDRVNVVYNAGNERHAASEDEDLDEFEGRAPTVTFIGRITYQKGPLFFVRAAREVIEQLPDVQFCVVGTGDMLSDMQRLVEELGISESFQFEGFLGPAEVKAKLRTSDVFVMPSVSEPFGIVALEAIEQQIPVIISKQAGVSEVLHHVFKVDFWDVDRMADLILSLLKYPTIRNELSKNAYREMRKLSWLASARQCEQVYRKVIHAPHS